MSENEDAVAHVIGTNELASYVDSLLKLHEYHYSVCEEKFVLITTAYVLYFNRL